MRFTKQQYEQAIEALVLASQQLEPNSRCCNVCGDSGHVAYECGHNPLVAMEICVKIARETSRFKFSATPIVLPNSQEPVFLSDSEPTKWF